MKYALRHVSSVALFVLHGAGDVDHSVLGVKPHLLEANQPYVHNSVAA